MSQEKAPLPNPGEAMRMKTEDIVFGVVALVAIVALVLYMN